MRIGIITDIHDDVEQLRKALEILSAQSLDVIVQLGDACDLFAAGQGKSDVIQLLNSAGVVGTWGNHDCGYCFDVSEEVKQQVSPSFLAYMAGMKPRLEIGGCHFSHVDPYLDPNDVVAMWMTTAKPDNLEKAIPSFAAVPHRLIFLGHYHRWIVVSDAGAVSWDATSPLQLSPERRYLIVVGPLVSGQFGVYDTDTGVLTPFRC